MHNQTLSILEKKELLMLKHLDNCINDFIQHKIHKISTLDTIGEFILVDIMDVPNEYRDYTVIELLIYYEKIGFNFVINFFWKEKLEPIIKDNNLSFLFSEK